MHATYPESAIPPKVYVSATSRWTAISNRDPLALGHFVYAVRTTGIYCHANCSARLARRANIIFYNDAAEAEHNGFRACKRCKPNLLPEDDEHSIKKKIHHAVQVVQRVAQNGQKISLAELSKQVGLSKWHLQRVFKRHEGVSPRQMSIRTIEATTTPTHIMPILGDAPCSDLLFTDDEIMISPYTYIGHSLETLNDFKETEDAFYYSNFDSKDILQDLFPEICYPD